MACTSLSDGKKAGDEAAPSDASGPGPSLAAAMRARVTPPVKASRRAMFERDFQPFVEALTSTTADSKSSPLKGPLAAVTASAIASIASRLSYHLLLLRMPPTEAPALALKSDTASSGDGGKPPSDSISRFAAGPVGLPRPVGTVPARAAPSVARCKEAEAEPEEAESMLFSVLAPAPEAGGGPEPASDPRPLPLPWPGRRGG